MFYLLFPIDCQFEGLTSLSLNHFTAREDELIGFLKRQATLLKNWHPENIYLVRSWPETARPCWVRIIRQPPEIFQLTAVELSGHFWNGGRQRFKIAYPGEHPELEDETSDPGKARTLYDIINRDVRELESWAVEPGYDDLHQPYR